MLITRAPAKVNLTLHVLGRRAADGYHELESLVAFTGAGDVLSFEPGASLSLAVDGPTARAAGEGAENLVLRAACELSERLPQLRLGAFYLTKRLPVAAGLGGGSSDAAAALRLLAQANALERDDPRLLEAAQATGADVTVCLAPQARMMLGAGETVGAPLQLAPLPAVLINPGVAVATRSVFQRLGLQAGERAAGAAPHPALPERADREASWRLLGKCRNDLEPAALAEAPVIRDVLALLGAARGCKLARMSGSGATCFGLFISPRAAARAAAAIRATHPHWWVSAAMLR
ncbi:4-(cytidine 5'-diphospho)-2-C-methyl-D-erythritol kinase [Methylocystis bryophila]|uniref:4-diphosphocytidyl-2-C-methyl-D-erythritol kinase n=1 Tax=Methylocystis bryophila TaxID=655015 RepID=A0A1W6MX43_9HYPH|nr:4-(cytidine 5'-diphospho)-2-C-methyl-D-erythritol kinase [Methylocystis bryophila]ARN82148.1 4-(cytidine 5'-diphospho)-2-C-methyl-D-erythritol kinase [Methylocystis bryophila]BDV38279.1 4-diphosphocytidyl-2-C-methyl-D-erythritol kinase [Methylocystis bryophila]